MKRVFTVFILLILILTIYSCGCADIKEVSVHIIYQDAKELKNIKNYIEKYCLPTECDNREECIRYLVSIQHLQSNIIDTVIPAPEFPNVGVKNNIKLVTKIVKDSLNAFDFNSKELFNNPITDSIKFHFQNKLQDEDLIFAFVSNKKGSFFDSRAKLFHSITNLSDSINFHACKDVPRFCIVWEPKINIEGPGQGPGQGPDTIVPPSPPIDCNVNDQLKSLISHASKGQKLGILNTLRSLAFNAIKCEEAISVKTELNKIETSKLKSFISEYGPEYKGVIAALEYEDTRLINEPIGRLKEIREGVYQVTMLTSNDVYINSTNSNDLPAFKVYTKRFQLTDPLKVTLNWAKTDGGYDLVSGNLKPGTPITKTFEAHNVTITMNSNEQDPFVKIELSVKQTTTPGGIEGGGGTGGGRGGEGIDMSKDNDGDGYIGYLDKNDQSKSIMPKIENAERDLNQKIDFKVIDGDNIDGVKYEWFVNGVTNPEKYFTIKEVGCYEIKVRMTHINSGVSKELISEVHGTLPKEVLKQDLKAILRVGQYKSPSKPPSTEVEKANQAEKRIEGYFAPGCIEVRDSKSNQKKSLNELLNADLRGAAGTIFDIDVKSITYKNNGCDKVCSFSYELKK